MKEKEFGYPKVVKATFFDIETNEKVFEMDLQPSMELEAGIEKSASTIYNLQYLDKDGNIIFDSRTIEGDFIFLDFLNNTVDLLVTEEEVGVKYFKFLKKLQKKIAKETIEIIYKTTIQ